MSRTALVAVVLAILGYSGCGEEEEQPDGGRRVVRPRVPENARPIRWSLGPIPAPEDRAFSATINLGGCNYKAVQHGSLHGPEVVYTPDRLIVTFFLESAVPRKGPVICHPIASLHSERVRLSEPIGERDLFDGGLSPPKLTWDNPAGD